ncbi:nitroreductase [Seminavis robusta]|uniref:Nitroreductase n=1 Tax=Seminavis robusta TaxID=568900 RepID=A0A9N8HR98_9STRA|nr:nitroreductase [Seminavis robusta]|eukprot:Sro1370_g267000.1 nitroreductase (319) ;mRNA; f:11455-12411
MWGLSRPSLSLIVAVVAQNAALTAFAFAPPSASTSRVLRQQSLSVQSVALSDSLSSVEQHALEVFEKFATESSDISSSEDLYEILCSLDVEATQDEADVLFRYLDEDADGALNFDDFLPWYKEAADAATAVAESFQSLLVGRRTIEQFDRTPIGNDVLERAVQCAIAAPNRSMSEPWRFIRVGPETISKFAELNLSIRKNMETDDGSSSVYDWTTVPGWCVVTTKISPNDADAEQEDFKSVSCAIQNFMLSMWSEGVGTKWTSGPVQKTQEFADLCGVDTSIERVVGCIWFGYATGGGNYADPRRRRKEVKDVLSHLP